MRTPSATIRPTGDFADRVQAGLRAQSPEPLEALWPELPQVLDDDGGVIASVISRFLDIEDTAAGAAIGAREALGIGVVTASGAFAYADALLAACLHGAHEDPAFLGLLDRARSQYAAIGVLNTLDGEVVTAWAGGPLQACERWPMPIEAHALLKRGSGRLVVVVYAPTRSRRLAIRATAALGFTPQQAKLADALLTTPTLASAAAAIGVDRSTAKVMLQSMCVRAGVRRSTELVGRLVDLMCAAPGDPSEEGVVAAALGLTRAEARAALALGAGLTAPSTAAMLGLKSETVRGYARTILAKTGVRRTKDLARLLVETRELTTLSKVDEPVFFADTSSASLRVINADDGRRIAFFDYGPRGGRAVLITHGSASGATLPLVFTRALQKAGLRPLLVQRPGFGLTDPTSGDFLDAAASDMANVIEQLKLCSTVVLAREGAAATVLRLAERHPEKVGRVVLVNPRSPLHLARAPAFPLAVAARYLLGSPTLVGPVAELLRRRNTRGRLERLARQSCAESPTDLSIIADGDVLDELVRGIQMLTARSVSGFVAEFRVWADGWTVPEVEVGRWTIVRPGDLQKDPEDPYAKLPGAKIVDLNGGGFLTWFTHADELTTLLLEP